jgi:hypothetical protein
MLAHNCIPNRGRRMVDLRSPYAGNSETLPQKGGRSRGLAQIPDITKQNSKTAFKNGQSGVYTPVIQVLKRWRWNRLKFEPAMATE